MTKIHYRIHGYQPLCGVKKTNRTLSVTGENEVHLVTCQRCQSSIYANVNVGDDKLVEYDGNGMLKLVEVEAAK